MFTLLAVAQPLALEPAATANELKRAAEGKVLAEGTLTRRFRTRRRRVPPVDIAAAMLCYEVARRVNACHTIA